MNDDLRPQPLTTSEAHLALFQAIREAGKIGNQTDDKLILAALNRAGIYLFRHTAGVRPSEGLRYYCNKCGSFPSAREHNRPNGAPCPYLASGGIAGVDVPGEGRKE